MTERSDIIGGLIQAQRIGHSLAREFYFAEGIFKHDMNLLADRWIYAGHISQVAEPGQFLTVELGRESAIVVRAKDGELHAHANVCRHRGSRICNQQSGKRPVFVCPYHGWSYELNGDLRIAREMPDGFDASDHRLLSLPLRVAGGLVFISFGNSPPAFSIAQDVMSDIDALYGWSDAKVALTRSYSINGNWKLAMENYHECYHCAPAHPEFAKLHLLTLPRDERDAAEKAYRDQSNAAGRRRVDTEHWAESDTPTEVARLLHSVLRDNDTGSRDGKPVAPLMPGVEELDRGCSFAEIGMLTALLAYADHGVIYFFNPTDVGTTQLQVTWLVNGEAEAGRDYDPGQLAWLWDATSLEDKRIIEDNAAGVASRHYRPGPYSKMENGARLYVEHYLSLLAKSVVASEPA